MRLDREASHVQWGCLWECQTIDLKYFFSGWKSYWYFTWNTQNSLHFKLFPAILDIVLTLKLEIWLVSPSLKLIKNKSTWTYIHFKYFFVAYHTIQVSFNYRISYENYTVFPVFFSFAVKATTDSTSLIPRKLIKWIFHTIAYYFPVMYNSLWVPNAQWLICEAGVLSDFEI